MGDILDAYPGIETGRVPSTRSRGGPVRRLELPGEAPCNFLNATTSYDDHQPRLSDLVGRDDADEPTVLAALLADPRTAKMIAAWRRSVLAFKAVRQAAIDRGDIEREAWLNEAVTVRVNE